MNSNSEWLESLRSELTLVEERFRKSKQKWNFWYYLSLYGAIFLSAFSALTLKSEIILDAALKNDLAATCATIAAILGTAMTAGSFERRWTAARLARTSIHKLKISIKNPSADPQEISNKLKKVLDDYTRQVLGNDE